MQRPETPIPALVYPLQVAFVLDPDDTIYSIHARPLTEREKRRFRRRSLVERGLKAVLAAEGRL